jgi:hypothetical protein
MTIGRWVISRTMGMSSKGADMGVYKFQPNRG